MKKFSKHMQTLRLSYKWMSGNEDSIPMIVPLIGLDGLKDKKERLIRGMMFFEVPEEIECDVKVPLSKAIGASMVLGNQDGKYLYLYISLLDNHPSYIGNVVDYQQIPGIYILEHPYMGEARYKEYKDNPESIALEEKKNSVKRLMWKKFDVWAERITQKSWQDRQIGMPYDLTSRDNDNLSHTDNHGLETLRRFIKEDADFIINADYYSDGSTPKESFYASNVREKVQFLKELCNDFFLANPRRWFEDKPFIELKDAILDTLIYAYPGIGTDPLRFRRDNLLVVKNARKVLEEKLNSDLDASAKLDVYIDCAVSETAKIFDTKKALHTLSVVDIFDGLAGYMVGALAPDNAFNIGTLVGRDLGPIAEDKDDENKTQNSFKRVYEKLNAAHLWAATQEDLYKKHPKQDELLKLWYKLKVLENDKSYISIGRKFGFVSWDPIKNMFLDVYVRG